jgi:hypothetical protein
VVFDNDQADRLSVIGIAEALLGDSRLQITDARFYGSCQALVSAAFPPPHALAAFFPAAVVLSTGDAAQAAGNVQAGGQALSTDWQQPGDSSLGAYTHDAAVLELDISTSPELAGNQQIVLSYLFGSEEYGTKNPNPDMVSITISSSNSGGGGSRTGGAAAATDVAVVPGGGRIPAPSVSGDGEAAVQVFSNAGGRYRTALNGFTQVSSGWMANEEYAQQNGYMGG